VFTSDLMIYNVLTLSPLYSMNLVWRHARKNRKN